MAKADIQSPEDSGKLISKAPNFRRVLGTLKVQKRACATCIYGKNWYGTPVEQLEALIADAHGHFKGSRICHHSENATCRGFWNRHKNEFAAGQIAQRLGCVEFVMVDTWRCEKEQAA